MKRRLTWLLVLLMFVAGCGGGSWSSGDRVLVNKADYDSGESRPRRFDVVVFRCPEPPARGGPLDNFIKRLLGLAGETLAIFFGHVFVTTDWQPPQDLSAEHSGFDPTKANPLDLWRPEYMYRNDVNARELFKYGKFTPRDAKGPKIGKFTILRKDPETMLALRRLVYDNDFPAKDLDEAHFPPRWAPQPSGWPGVSAGWEPDDDHGFQGSGKDMGLLRYRHILRPWDWPGGQDRTHKPQLITDFSGYNSYEKQGQRREIAGNWVGDLMLELDLTVDQPRGELWLELSRAVDRFQARFNLETGRCTLVRLPGLKAPVPTELQSADTPINKPGTYHLCFANFDERLTVWVDGSLPFGEGVEYLSSWHFDREQKTFVNTGPTTNDLEPASIARVGVAAVKVHHLQLWRNTYYTIGGQFTTAADVNLPGPSIPDRLREPLSVEEERERNAVVAKHWEEIWSDPHPDRDHPDQWRPLCDLDFATMYVQKGHYLCMGDNSPESHDSRAWGTVPERLMLGRALMVYFPFSRAGLIR